MVEVTVPVRDSVRRPRDAARGGSAGRVRGVARCVAHEPSGRVTVRCPSPLATEPPEGAASPTGEADVGGALEILADGAVDALTDASDDAALGTTLDPLSDTTDAALADVNDAAVDSDLSVVVDGAPDVDDADADVAPVALGKGGEAVVGASSGPSLAEAVDALRAALSAAGAVAGIDAEGLCAEVLVLEELRRLVDVAEGARLAELDRRDATARDH
ncbi:MAG: hypothetical protein U0Q07_13050 [Acidimicrobiales bacterium]